MDATSPKRKIVLFDFDGVIADSFDIAFEVNKMIYPHMVEDDYRKAFEGNINDWEDSIPAKKCRQDLDFFEEYIPKMKDVKMVQGMSEVIKNLSHLYTLIIVSSTITSPIKKFMEKNNVARYFTEIMGNDVHKSKVEKIKMIFSKYGPNTDRYIFVTDTLGDMKEASQVGIKTIGVGWGFHTKKTLAERNPISIVKNPEELANEIDKYFKKIVD